jgi:DNA topoisomerase-1
MDLKKRSLDRLDTEYVRIGNREYARSNRSFGATTLKTHHLLHKGGRLRMRFPAKHGIIRELTITDRNLKRIVRKCQELPGQQLFQFINGDGEPQAVTSADVNDYIRNAAGADFTAKHFRTWGASVIFFEQLLAADQERRIGLNTALEPVAEALGNSAAISRKSYVHPKLVQALQDRPGNPLRGMKSPRARRRLSVAESGLLKFLARVSRTR